MIEDTFQPVSSAKRLTLLNTGPLRQYGAELYQNASGFRIGLLGNLPEHCRWLYTGAYNDEGSVSWQHYTAGSCLLSGYEPYALTLRFKAEQVVGMLQAETSIAEDTLGLQLDFESKLGELLAALRLAPRQSEVKVAAAHSRLGLKGLHLLTHHPARWVQANPEFQGMPHDLLLRMHGLRAGSNFYRHLTY